MGLMTSCLTALDTGSWCSNHDFTNCVKVEHDRIWKLMAKLIQKTKNKRKSIDVYGSYLMITTANQIPIPAYYWQVFDVIANFMYHPLAGTLTRESFRPT